jgi:hypothetical protein
MTTWTRIRANTHTGAVRAFVLKESQLNKESRRRDEPSGRVRVCVDGCDGDGLETGRRVHVRMEPSHPGALQGSPRARGGCHAREGKADQSPRLRACKHCEYSYQPEGSRDV